MMKRQVTSKSLFFGLLFIISYSVTFIHKGSIKLTDWEPYAENKKEYKKIISKANLEIDNVILDLRSNGLNEYADRLENSRSAKKTDLKAYTSKKNTLKDSFSFFGYPSLRVFLYDVGKSIFPFFPVVFLVILILNPKLILRYKNFLLIGVFGFLYIVFFWIFHNLFSQSDFSETVYSISYFLLSFVASIVVFSLLIYISKREKKRQDKEKDLESIVESGKELIALFKDAS